MKRITAVLIALAMSAFGVVAVAEPASASTCTMTKGGYSHTYICEYWPEFAVWNGRSYYFIVALDGAIYETHETAPNNAQYTGWRSLGGVGRSAVWVYDMTSANIEIYVEGTDGGGWCNWGYTNNTWSGWWDCA